MGAPIQAQAQHRADTLNEDNITEFLQDISDQTSGNGLESSPDSIKTFLQRHLHKNARFKSKMEYNIPGQPTQQKSMSLDKQQFINNTGAGSNALDGYESEVEIVDIRLSGDKTKATVKTNGFESGYIEVDDGNGYMAEVPMNGISSCTQIIMLNDNHVIQLYHANCETTINFEN